MEAPHPEMAATIRRRCGLSSPSASLALYVDVEVVEPEMVVDDLSGVETSAVTVEVTRYLTNRALIEMFCAYANEPAPKFLSADHLMFMARRFPDVYASAIEGMKSELPKWTARIEAE